MLSLTIPEQVLVCALMGAVVMGVLLPPALRRDRTAPLPVEAGRR